MPEVPIIGDNNTKGEMPPDPDQLKMFHKAFVVAMDENGQWYALDHGTPIDTFQGCTPPDVINGCRRVVDSLRDQEAAATALQTNMAMAQRLQEHAQTQQLIQNLNLKGK